MGVMRKETRKREAGRAIRVEACWLGECGVIEKQKEALRLET